MTQQSKFMTREDILAYRDTDIDFVDVPGFSEQIGIANLTADEAHSLQTLGKNGIPAAAELMILGACDDQGSRLFTKEDGPRIAAISARVVGAIAQAVIRKNGLSMGEAPGSQAATE